MSIKILQIKMLWFYRKLHVNSRPHVCSECNHPFIQMGDLRKHIRSKHTQEKPFECSECGKTFARSDYLLKHTRAHKKQSQQNANNNPEVEEEDDVNALLSEAMLNDGVALETLESTEPMELVLPHWQIKFCNILESDPHKKYSVHCVQGPYYWGSHT